MIKVIFNPGRYQEVPLSLVRRAVAGAAKRERALTGEVEINLIGEKKIKEINARYRRVNKVTDVLSFAWKEGTEKKSIQIKDSMLGQIFICFPQIKRQAQDYGVTAPEEFVRMLTHGLLHLAGFDHITMAQERQMSAQQEEIIKYVLH